MIIWLASYPRSGNTYYRMLLHYMRSIQTYSLYDDPLLDKIGATDMIGHKALPAPLVTLRDEADTFFVKTHELPSDADPAVYIVRDGRDAIVSFARYLLSFQSAPGLIGSAKRRLGIESFRRTLRSLIATAKGRRSWSDHVLQWSHRSKGTTFIIRYEDLVGEPERWVQASLDALQVQSKSTEGRELPSFTTLHEAWPEFFRKGKAATWRDEMPHGLHELFWAYHGEAMREFGYSDGATCNSQIAESWEDGG